jgi:hypothetical protein
MRPGLAGLAILDERANTKFLGGHGWCSVKQKDQAAAPSRFSSSKPSRLP